MADVRAMLRGERNARKVKHSQAAYTSTGQLMCSVCRCPVKSAAAWDAHLQSEGHAALVQKIQKMRHASTDTEAGSQKRKRKADSDEAPNTKRSRNLSVSGDATPSTPSVSYEGLTSPIQPVAEEPNEADKGAVKALPPKGKTSTHQIAVDEAEWAAFQKDLELIDQEEKKQEAVQQRQTAKVISAPPMTAEQLAVKAREEQSAQKGKQETEVEDERDEAQEQMEDEFSYMESMEEKMRAWRARREALRHEPVQSPAAEQEGGKDQKEPSGASSEDDDDEEGDDDDDDDDDDDAWRGLGGL